MTKIIAFSAFVLALCWMPAKAQYISGGSGGGGGSAVIACVGTPGNTTGTYRQQCQTAAGALYVCNNAAGCSLAADWALVGPTTPTANQNIRSFGAAFDGGGAALISGAGSTTYSTIPFACTIQAWNITADTGTVSFDVWKIATGTAIPTVSNTILTGGYLALSTGTAIHSTTLTNFTTTAVSANDIIGVNIEAVASATKVSLVIQCSAS